MTFRHACGHLTSQTASLSFGRYQIILLGDRGTAHVCEQLAQSCYLAAERPGIKLMTYRSLVQRPNHHITKPHVIQVTVIIIIIIRNNL